MKKLLLILAASVAAASGLFAQSLTITNPDYTTAGFFTASTGYSVTGLTSDGLGNVFYLESDLAFPGSLSAKLWTRPFAGGGFGAPTLLHDFAASLSGNFLTLHNGLIYGGENSTGSLFSIGTDGSAFDPLGTVSGNYDGAFFNNSLFLSRSAGGVNTVSAFSLVPDGTGGMALSAGVAILNAGSQPSGPLDFSDGGELLYGSSVNGIYQYSSAEVSAGSLVLDSAHRLAANGVNSYLADGGGSLLWQDSYDSTDLHLIDKSNGAVQTIGTAGGVFPSLGSLESAGGTLFAVVTDYGAGSSRVFAVNSVPEPSASGLLAAGVAFWTARRQRKFPR